jgi:hypothetical protein
MTDQEILFIRKFIETHPFKFAKSMPYIPHEYVLSKNVPEEEFHQFAKLIHDNGTDEKFGKRLYRYLYYQDHKYWILPSPTPGVFVLNRARIKKATA